MATNKPVRIIISGGGTGGHIYPAIAIANALKETSNSVELLFVGAIGKMEMQKVPQAGYKIIGLPIAGLQRKLTAANLLFPFKVINSIWKAKSILKEFKPDVAVGVGGYASGPLLYAAASAGIPTLIQEQNSYAGLTNKWLAKNAKKICVAYPDMSTFFPSDKIIVTGNPVRKDILDTNLNRSKALQHFKLAENKPTILVIGGSLGARTINETLKASLQTLSQANVQVIWQTGKFYFESCKQATASYSTSNIQVHDFIAPMDLAYGAADVVISRAGALSISELCLAAKPAVLVPSPNVSEDHQTKNAMALVNNQAALMVKDAEAMEKLIPATLSLLGDESKKRELAINIRKLGKPDAAKQIAQEILKLIK
ncbi:undecaprenyldiphospho-muramoylpentapeptide beta-N-acetylglucosaminyltransferase [Rhodocytophaga rosea]|uniref:UDP-N-acetylglucosamine--N-acetylmuramyl-(pentapeptide) pyrophosphoryl-undecaprenol N-acetylglucosamine transferase n=1 Tax=Rhodocytophaga rosea TaxID=2704465 RepID=A0A6C0GMT5_9BACT|nr:undecaprenyldiphospho-muramoylpentapeptide beta-N-acetylglucosaminyltransferase [Rhodocytophaga rosea]QHT69329.1 undecaprenyldiphospho-muramoylpentapeptide beta-N-acetylglucosaminyltransferase [Rhodocytophaga rosea]